MSDQDFNVVSSVVDEEKEFLNTVSRDIWQTPELAFKEFQAHAILTGALQKFGFPVEKHYFLTTAFRAEYCVKAGGPTVAVILEYDALPEIGHACGHNLIAEAGLGAAIAVKKAMEQDRSIAGKIVVLGTPAEESGGGKLRLIELGAFDKVDVAMMVHPAPQFLARVSSMACINCDVVYKGKEAHAAAFPWEGINALDAAVACYNGIAVLRQQIKHTNRIHAIISDGGMVRNVIPARAKLKLSLRSMTVGDLMHLRSRIEACINGAATSTGCSVEYHFDDSNAYYNMISSRILADTFETYCVRLGMDVTPQDPPDVFSTDMGNVCHVVPGIHILFPVPCSKGPHSKEFAEAAKSPEAQTSTLMAAKALAMTCLTVMRDGDTLQKVKEQFAEDIAKDA